MSTESKIPIYRRHVTPGISFTTFSSEGTEKIGEVVSEREFSWSPWGASHIAFSDSTTLFGLPADAALAYAQAGQKGLRFEEETTPRMKELVEAFNATYDPAIGGCLVPMELTEAIWQEHKKASAKPEPVRMINKVKVPGHFGVSAATGKLEPLHPSATVRYSAPYGTFVEHNVPAQPAPFLKPVLEETRAKFAEMIHNVCERNAQDFRESTGSLLVRALDPKPDLLEAFAGDLPEPDFDASNRVGAPEPKGVLVATTRHDCLFVGGPRGEQIHEIDDDCGIHAFGNPDHSETPVYDRTGPTTFTFRHDTPEPKVETWMDRSRFL